MSAEGQEGGTPPAKIESIAPIVTTTTPPEAPTTNSTHLESPNTTPTNDMTESPRQYTFLDAAGSAISPSEGNYPSVEVAKTQISSESNLTPLDSRPQFGRFSRESRYDRLTDPHVSVVELVATPGELSVDFDQKMVRSAYAGFGLEAPTSLEQDQLLAISTLYDYQRLPKNDLSEKDHEKLLDLWKKIEPFTRYVQDMSYNPNTGEVHWGRGKLEMRPSIAKALFGSNWREVSDVVNATIVALRKAETRYRPGSVSAPTKNDLVDFPIDFRTKRPKFLPLQEKFADFEVDLSASDITETKEEKTESEVLSASEFINLSAKVQIDRFNQLYKSGSHDIIQAIGQAYQQKKEIGKFFLLSAIARFDIDDDPIALKSFITQSRNAPNWLGADWLKELNNRGEKMLSLTPPNQKGLRRRVRKWFQSASDRLKAPSAESETTTKTQKEIGRKGETRVINGGLGHPEQQLDGNRSNGGDVASTWKEFSPSPDQLTRKGKLYVISDTASMSATEGSIGSRETALTHAFVSEFIKKYYETDMPGLHEPHLRAQRALWDTGQELGYPPATFAYVVDWSGSWYSGGIGNCQIILERGGGNLSVLSDEKVSNHHSPHTGNTALLPHYQDLRDKKVTPKQSGDRILLSTDGMGRQALATDSSRAVVPFSHELSSLDNMIAIAERQRVSGQKAPDDETGLLIYGDESEKK